MPDLLPLFINLQGRRVVLVGGGPVAAGKLQSFLSAGAIVTVVAPDVVQDVEHAGVSIVRRAFEPSDLDGAWLVVAAATPAVNREVAAAAEARRVFVNAVDDPPNASAYLGGVVRRDGVTIAVSTSGAAPALTALLRQALDAMLPNDLTAWMAEAGRQRTIWRRDQVPMRERKPRLLKALNELYVGLRAQGSGLKGEGLRAQGSGLTGEGLRAQGSGLTEALSPQLSALSPSSALSPQPSALSSSSGLSPSSGHVSLVGAGPGDPALLTRKAIARLRTADLVLYDALIDDRILRYARKAQRFFVGKRAGRPSGQGTARSAKGLTQAAIHGVMIRAARRGRRVVRLKGGDPFVFGRGGEEMLALARAAVPYEVVPGVTSALATPALAGIPLTHRGVSSAFLVVSGHDVDAFSASVGQTTPNGLTLVVLMGLGHSAAIGGELVRLGWLRSTPVAVIFDASSPGQRVWRGTLGELISGVSEGESGGPATIVIGEVVGVGMQAAGTAPVQRASHVNSR